MSAPAPLLIDGLRVRFGERTALAGVSLTAQAGELVALAGPNGSGKTTLLRAGLGLLMPEAGRVELFGDPCADLSIRERARRVAWVPQEESPRDNLGLREYVLYGRYAHLAPFAGDSAEDRQIADQAIAEAGLADRKEAGILELSGGERQRLLLARALAQRTPLLLLDEPTAHLDIGHQLDLFERVRAQVRDRQLCAVAAMHDLNLAARFADRILVLSHGRLVAEGSPESVLSAPLLREVWGVETELRRDPRTHRPYLLPHRSIGASNPPAPAERRRGPVHVVAGGGSGVGLLHRLLEEGYAVTAGPLPLLDSDAEAAAELGIPFAPEVPFAPFGVEAIARAAELLASARAAVLAPVPIGPGNLANLELLGRARPRIPVFVLGERAGLDFTGGAASARLAELLSNGATAMPDVEALLAALALALPAPPLPAVAG